MNIVRPQNLSEEARSKLEFYLLHQWERAERSRVDQIDSKYVDWGKNYNGIPAETVRTVPWYKSSNFVVKVIRMFVETFAARTLNIVFATNPLITVKNFPREISEGLQYYLDHKARNDWQYYQLFNRMLYRGAKNGTVVTKTNYIEDIDIDVVSAQQEQTILNYAGPQTRVIPFPDIFLFPITACSMDEVEIKFHRLRYTVEAARRKVAEGKWTLSDEDILLAADRPKDVARREGQQEAGIYDQELEEIVMIECHLKYPITNDPSKYYSIVAVIQPDLRRLVDVYHNPYPGNFETFHLYTPSPREDCIYGESWAEVLGQSQEEISQIHNDRRNSSFLASAPVFKRKTMANVPNPSTNWYPGKVFDLEEMDDLDTMSLGRDTGDMINEELHVFALAERLMGIGPIMQGASQGGQGKGGIYNTGGVLAVMSEGNQRQDTNIRDAREVLGSIARCSYFLQSHFAPKDPVLDMMPPEVKAAVQQAFAFTTRDRIRSTKFEIKASSAGANRETEKASLLQMGNFLAQHSQLLQALTPQIVSMQNPQVKAMLTSILNMSSWMARRLLAAYDEPEAIGELPDVKAILESGGSVPGVGPGGAPGAGVPLTRPALQQISQMGGPNGGPPQ
ncbi:MAG TPA: hypothetical protein VIY48_07215 [Candidatus Paceibacterota bacterium]